MSPQRWSYHMDQDGRVQEKQELIKAVFKGVSMEGILSVFKGVSIEGDVLISKCLLYLEMLLWNSV